MNVIGFKPHVGQKQIIKQFADSHHKYGVVVCGRQFGKSLLAQNVLLYWLANNANTNGCWISPIYKQARKVFDEMVESCKPIITKSNKSELSITFINGSTLIFLSAERPDGIRGFSFHYMVVDESADIKEEAMTASILPTLSVLGRKCLIISTPKGKNWLYQWWLKGNEENPHYISFKGVSLDNPHADKAFIEECRKSYPTSLFKQEFEAEFADSGNDVFKSLDNAIILTQPTKPRHGSRYYAGIDTAISGDYCVCVIMDERGRVVETYRHTNRTFEQHANSIIRLLKQYGVNATNFETNGVGYGLFELINKHHRLNKWHTTNDNKARGIQNLIYDIEESLIELPNEEWEPAFMKEFSAYTYKQNPNGRLVFNAPNGFHDDCVMATMLANEARRLGGLGTLSISRI